VREEVMDMDCAQFEEVLHDLGRAETSATLRESALAHAESCERCARLMTEAEALDYGLRSLAAQDAEQQAPGRVAEALLREFRRERSAAPRRRVQWQLAALGAAAAVALALGVSLWHKVPQHSITGASGGSTGTSTAQSGTQGNAAVVAGQLDANNSSGSEYATAFVPLPYADDAAMSDGGAVVRVVLSRSALASLGVPVTDVSDTTPIPADLVVSEDGTPQAIRLVSQASAE
jgi:hypothetical protein